VTRKEWRVYLSGEIHSKWRDEIIRACKKARLPITFYSPVTNHAASDNCGIINAIRTRALIDEADIVVVRFGDKYKEWNAAFDAGYAAALGKPLIVQHHPDNVHALKEVDAAAYAVTETVKQVIEILKYVTKQK
jgi:nucleoside 2-deoxyribosyltransferase